MLVPPDGFTVQLRAAFTWQQQSGTPVTVEKQSVARTQVDEDNVAIISIEEQRRTYGRPPSSRRRLSDEQPGRLRPRVRIHSAVLSAVFHMGAVSNPQRQ